MIRFPLYFAARSSAHDLHARGWRPGLFLQLLVLVPAAFMLLLAGGTALLVIGLVIDHALFPA